MTDWSSYDSADVAEMEMPGNTWITLGSIDVSIPLDDKIEHPVNKIGCSAKVNLKVFFNFNL